MTTVVTLSNRLEPSARAFLETVNSSGDPPIYQLPVSDARGVLSGAQSGPVEKMDARIEDHVIKGGPHGEISIRIVEPAEVDEPVRNKRKDADAEAAPDPVKNQGGDQPGPTPKEQRHDCRDVRYGQKDCGSPIPAG